MATEPGHLRETEWIGLEGGFHVSEANVLKIRNLQIGRNNPPKATKKIYNHKLDAYQAKHTQNLQEKHAKNDPAPFKNRPKAGSVSAPFRCTRWCTSHDWHGHVRACKPGRLGGCFPWGGKAMGSDGFCLVLKNGICFLLLLSSFDCFET